MTGQLLCSGQGRLNCAVKLLYFKRDRLNSQLSCSEQDRLNCIVQLVVFEQDKLLQLSPHVCLFSVVSHAVLVCFLSAADFVKLSVFCPVNLDFIFLWIVAVDQYFAWPYDVMKAWN